MRVAKSPQLSFSAQPVELRGTMHHACTISLGFSLLDGSLLPEGEGMQAAMAELTSGEILDSGMPKPCAEWLLCGSACTAGAPVTGQAVEIRVGNSTRRFIASDGKTPFLKMPLSWAGTWGGPHLPENPLGCGLGPDAATGNIVAPTLIDPALPLRAPACPGPMGAWPARLRLLGTYDKKWLQERWPGFPDDMDMHFFNLAQPSQRVKGFWRGDETFLLRGLHTEHTEISGHLPGRGLRMEIRRVQTGDWEAVPVSADTLWLFPAQLTGILLWHGMFPCADEQASDIAELRLALTPEEQAEQAAPLGNAASVSSRTAGPAAEARVETAAVGLAAAAAVAGVAAAATSADGSSSASAPHTRPPDTAEPSAAAVRPPATAGEQMRQECEQLLDTSLDEINEALVSMNQPPLTPQQLQETKEYIAQQSALFDEMWAKVAEEQAQDQSLTGILARNGVPQDRINAVNAALELSPPTPEDFSDELSWNAAIAAFIEKFSALLQPSDDVVDMLKSGLQLMGPGGAAKLDMLTSGMRAGSLEELLCKNGVSPQQGAALSDAMERFPDSVDSFADMAGQAKTIEQLAGLPPASVQQIIKDAHDMLVENKLIEAEPAMQTLAAIPPARFSPPATSAAASEHSAAAPAAETATTEAPQPTFFSAAQGKNDGECAGASDHARQEHTGGHKPQSDTSGALLVAGILAAAGTLAGAGLAGAKLAHMDFSGQDFSGADLRGADITGTNFSGCNMTGVNVSGASGASSQWREARLRGADMTGLYAPDADFSKADLSGANLHEASCGKADFTGVQAAQADFSGALLENTLFCDSSCPQANFSGAQLRRADFYHGDISRADFSRAQAQDMTLSGGTAAGARFSGANLRDCVWEQADGTSCTLTGADLHGAAMSGCCFRGAAFTTVSAVQADFSRSDFSGADLRGMNGMQASLRGACLAGADISYASLYGADVHRWRIDDTTKKADVDMHCTIVAAREKA